MADICDPLNSWQAEDIPGQDKLFMRVERSFVKNGEVIPGAFRNHPTETDGMSTDWSRYSTPQDTRQRAKVPVNNGVVEMLVSEVRQVPQQTVKHSPIPTNRSHTDVWGVKDPEVRLKLRRLARWVDGFQI